MIFSLSTLSRFKRTNENGIVDDIMNKLHKLTDLVFRITQQLLYVLHRKT